MITLRLESDLPLTDQVVHGIRSAIAGGAVKPGDELPPVRQLAADLGINLNTVARAYRELEREGLVVTARGRGTRVAARRSAVRISREELRSRVRDLLADAKLAGYGREQVRKLMVAELERRMG